MGKRVSRQSEHLMVTLPPPPPGGEDVVLESGNRRARRYLSSRERRRVRDLNSAPRSSRWREVFTVAAIGLLSAAVCVAAIYIRRTGR